ncbi:MAG: TonB family protein [Rhodothermales bacterium]
MKRSDWIGLFTSLALHAALLFLFTFLTAARPDEQQLGFIEVELGPFAEGRPVQESELESPNATEEDVTEQPKQVEPEASPPKQAKPVNLPDQPKEIPDEDKVNEPETKTISPETKNNDANVKKPEPKPETQPVRPLGSGAVDGTTGANSGSQGEGSDEEKSAPYDIQGLNRNATFSPLPAYREKVNATIRVQITVDPLGRVVRRIPVLKANPALDQAVMDALARWRFNQLPSNAPQENQTGTVTFRFRLE